MSRKLVLLMPLLMVLIGTLGVGFKIEKIETGGTIYIKADGSVDPPTAPISNVGNVHYTLTADISDSIVVERDNIVVDGAGYTVERVGGGDFIESKGKVRMNLVPEPKIMPNGETVPGIDLSRRSNVTIKDTTIKGFDDGIYLYRSLSNVISENNITNNYNGIMLEESSDNNSIHGNNLTDNGDGIKLWGSCNYNIISGNNVSKCGGGIWVFGSCNFNSVSENHIANNNYTGLDLYASSNNDISGNNITANDGEGIGLESSYNNGISENYIANNNYTGLVLFVSDNNSMSENQIIANNDEGIVLDNSFNNIVSGNDVRANNNYGIVLSSSLNNSIYGNHLTAVKNLTGIKLYDSSGNDIYGNHVTNNPWGITLESSSNNEVYGNHVANNTNIGILLWYGSGNNSIYGNDVADNTWGVRLESCSDNVVSGNYMAHNSYPGIRLYDSSTNEVYGNHVKNNPWGIVLESSSNNSIYHNNFVNNTVQVYDYSWDDPEVEPSVNIWDDGYPSGGNYWSDYAGVDGDSDGIGDIAYVIDSDNRDRYPLMEMIPEDTTPPNIAVLSPENKTYVANDVALTFTVDEAIVWIGYSLDGQGNVTIAGNTTLSSLSSEVHTLMVYAKDVAGNIGASETLYFGIEIPAPFPTWTVAAIVTTVVFAASLLVYFTKFKKTTQKGKQ